MDRSNCTCAYILTSHVSGQFVAEAGKNPDDGFVVRSAKTHPEGLPYEEVDV
jgi:hypothetical protein